MYLDNYLPVLNELMTDGQSMIDDRSINRNRMYWDEPVPFEKTSKKN